MAGSRITWTTLRSRPWSRPRARSPARRVGRARGHRDADRPSDQGPRGRPRRDIAITVPAEFDDAQSVARDTDDLALAGLDDIRGNITLPADGPVRLGDRLDGRART